MPALVVATLALQLWKTKTPGWDSIDTVRIGGVGIGWKPWQVIDVLGKPESKTGDMAGGSYVLARFRRPEDPFLGGVAIFFANGRTETIIEESAQAQTNILGIASLPQDIEQLYGKGRLIAKYPGPNGSQMINWKYPNGVSYEFTNGSLSSVQVSKDTWDEFQKSDWGVSIVDDKGSGFSDRSTGAITGTEVKGIIRNDRDARVKVKLRIRWSYETSKEMADVYDSKIYEIDPHDTVIFSERGGSISKPKIQEDIVYSITVKSVEEL